MTQVNEVRLAVYAAGEPEDRPHVEEVWEVRRDRCCPVCGGSPVCVETREGDYYDGPAWVCPVCVARFRLVVCEPRTGEDPDLAARAREMRGALGLSPREGDA